MPSRLALPSPRPLLMRFSQHQKAPEPDDLAPASWNFTSPSSRNGHFDGSTQRADTVAYGALIIFSAPCQSGRLDQLRFIAFSAFQRVCARWRAVSAVRVPVLSCCFLAAVRNAGRRSRAGKAGL